jgi:hypothetical protein
MKKIIAILIAALLFGIVPALGDVVDISTQSVQEPIFVYGPGMVRLTGRTVVLHLVGGDSSLAMNRLGTTESASCSCYVAGPFMEDGGPVKTGRYEVWTTNGVDSLRWAGLWINGPRAGYFTVTDSSIATGEVGSRALGASSVGTSEVIDGTLGSDDYGDLSIPNRALGLGVIYSENLETDIDIAGKLSADSLTADDPIFLNYIMTPAILPLSGGTSTPMDVWGFNRFGMNVEITGDTLKVGPGSTGGTVVLDDYGSAYSLAIVPEGLSEDVALKFTGGEGAAGDVLTSDGASGVGYSPVPATTNDVIAAALRTRPFWFVDFTTATGSALWVWTGAAISSATLTGEVGSAAHPGISAMTSSTSANSGYRYLTATDAILIGGGEVFESELSIYTTTNTTIRVGFLDTTTSADPTDGAWINIAGTTLSGKTANNTSISTTGTTYTVSTDTWYRVKVVVNSAASRVDFFAYTAAGAELWTNNLTTNIPTAAGRETGSGTIATNSGTSTVDVIQWDFLLQYWTKDLVR